MPKQIRVDPEDPTIKDMRHDIQEVRDFMVGVKGALRLVMAILGLGWGAVIYEIFFRRM